MALSYYFMHQEALFQTKVKRDDNVLQYHTVKAYPCYG